MKPAFATVLVIEDSTELREALSRTLADVALLVETCDRFAQVPALLQRVVPDLVFLDFELPDGNAFDVLAELDKVAPAPIVVGMSGIARPDQTFALACRGVRQYLHKPFDLERIGDVCREVRNTAPRIAPFVRGMVGHAPITEVENEVRAIMVDEALARARGSRRGASKLLSISRQMLQHILRKGVESSTAGGADASRARPIHTSGARVARQGGAWGPGRR
jgi:two-component system response regulator RegA